MSRKQSCSDLQARLDLLRALNAATASLQRSARCEEEIFGRFHDEILALNLVGVILLDDDDDQAFSIPAYAFPEQTREYLTASDVLALRNLRLLKNQAGLQSLLMDGQTVYLATTQAAVDCFLAAEDTRRAALVAAIGDFPWILAPFRLNGQMHGVMGLGGQRLESEDTQAIEAFTNHVAIAIENTRLFNASQQAEAQYRSLFEAANDGIAIIHPETLQVISINRRLEQIAGAPAKVIVGRMIMDLIGGDFARNLPDWWDTIQRTGSCVFDWPMRRASGEDRLLMVSANRFFANGRWLIQALVRDITEQKQAQYALLESEAKFRALAETVAAAIFIYRGENFIYANSTMANITGYSRDELMQLHFWDVAHPDYRDLVRARGLARQRGEKLPERYELKILSRQGDERWVDFVSRAIEYEGATAFLGTAFDITERKQAEKTLRENEETLRKRAADLAQIAAENAYLLEQATAERRHLSLLYAVGRELSTSLDADVILQRAISLTCQALGGAVGYAFLYVPEQKRLSIRALHGRDEYSVRQLDEQVGFVLGERGLAGWVALHQHAVVVDDVSLDPRWLHIPGIDDGVHSAVVAPVLEGGRLIGIFSVFHQETAVFTSDHLNLIQAICHQVSLALGNARRYQQVQNLVDMLAAEQYRLESMVGRLPVGVLLLDVEYRLIIANSLGQEILSALGPCDVGETLTHLGPLDLNEIVLRTDTLPVEIALPGPPQRLFEADARQIGNESRQWVITVREVTVERESQKRVHMQERLATVGQMAAGIAHDFNNIMAAILVYSDLLMSDASLPTASRDRLTVIQQQVQRAASLIRQILDFSRRSVMEQSQLDLLPFLKELEKLLGRVLPETIRVELVTQPDAYLVQADPTRLQQALMNLALNARDAMPRGGSLTFTLKHLSLAPQQPPPCPDLPAGDWICISVLDTGCGIPSDVMPRIFEPFFTTKAVGQGVGLGLSQVYGIVKQHEGYIDVCSQVDVGTRFEIYLPALQVRQEEKISHAASLALDGTNQTALVVEDDQATRDALKALLETYQFWVITASNGVEALEYCQRLGKVVDLVVTDIVMPEMGGVALYDALRQRWPAIKVLFVTGHPLSEDDQGLLERGGVYWLQKPFSVRDFIAAVQALLSS